MNAEDLERFGRHVGELRQFEEKNLDRYMWFSLKWYAAFYRTNRVLIKK